MDSLEGKMFSLPSTDVIATLVGCVLPQCEGIALFVSSNVLLCSCWQYALYKKMTQAAILIQSKFRSYHEQKKFQQSKRAAVLIQQYYRSYKEFGRLKPHHRGAAAALVQHKLR